eukprot:2733477-Alexandrium_andersonii.AAC.1
MFWTASGSARESRRAPCPKAQPRCLVVPGPEPAHELLRCANPKEIPVLGDGPCVIGVRSEAGQDGARE